MTRFKYILLTLIMLLSSYNVMAGHGTHSEEASDEAINIPETVLHHLADSYEWHIASYEGKHLSIPLPIILYSQNTGEWYFCTAHSLPENCFFNAERHEKIYEKLPEKTYDAFREEYDNDETYKNNILFFSLIFKHLTFFLLLFKLYAFNKFLPNIAIVIGPTPPGTGVI